MGPSVNLTGNLVPLQILLEFKEYATEVDVEFVRAAVRAIAFCAVSIESAAERWMVGCCCGWLKLTSFE